ncbi:MAG: GTPase Era [Eubacteriales bacterium]|nr:GTPase Era [Eubacteriales bacterium]
MVNNNNDNLNNDNFRSGFVGLIGRPNVGKSTLLNYVSGTRLAITSHKAQTTRNLIRAVYDDDDAQIVFLDTPGMHQPKNKLGNYMVSAARQGMADADVILLLIEAGYRPHVGALEKRILEMASQFKKQVILVINKTDSAEKEGILPLIEAFNNEYSFAAIIPVSAKTGDGVELLLGEIKKLLPAGPRYFPEDSYTDQTERMLAAEMIREQILRLTHEEIPHGTAVAIESFEEEYDENDSNERRHVSISAAILCDKSTHKGMIIGKQGQKLKDIGSRARKEIEEMLGCSCYLKLFVKVREDWRNRNGILNDLGYDSRES